MKVDNDGLALQNITNDRTIDKITKSIKSIFATAGTVVSTSYPELAPLVTGIVSLVNDSIPDFKLKRVEEAIKEIALFCYENHLEIEKLKKDEKVLYFTNKTINKIIGEIDETKRRAYLNILLGCWKNPEQKFEIRDYYFSILESLSNLEIHIIAFLYDPENYLTVRNIRKETVVGNITEVFRISFPQITEVEFKTAVTNLYSRGLTNLSIETFGMLMVSNGIDAVKGRWKDAGKK